MTPYPYQKDLFLKTLNAITEGHKGIAIYLPTRGGKSIVAMQLVDHYANGLKRPIWFLGHTKILIDQMSRELDENGYRHGIIAAGYPRLKYRIQVISKDSLHNRIPEMQQTWDAPAVMIIDEAHLCQAQRYKDIIAAFPDTVIVGLSASWIRLDRKGFTPPFTKLIKGPSIRELQDMGKLCKIETFVAELFDDTGIKTVQGDYNKTQVNERVDKPFVLSETVKHWEKHALGKKTLVFCASIKHADDMARQFSGSGHSAVSLSSANDAGDIRRTLERFYVGEFKILVSVDLFVMGFTVRDCECIIQARPTQSLMVYLQILGRGGMVSPGKTHLINLDTCNNYSRHGLPDIDREWTLTSPPKKDKGESTLKRCPDCERPVLRVLMECPHCGHIWEKSLVVERKINEKEGILVAISRRNEAQALIRDIARNARNIGDAMTIAASPQYAIPGKEVYETAVDIWERVLKNKKVLTH